MPLPENSLRRAGTIRSRLAAMIVGTAALIAPALVQLRPHWLYVAAMGAAGQVRARRLYSAKAMCEATFKVYATLLEGRE